MTDIIGISRLTLALVLILACRFGAAADIFDAVRSGDVEKVKTLLQADSKLTAARTVDGNTPLHLAALEGHAAVAKSLLDSQAQVNARGLREETPLHMAMYDGHREMAELLLANQADVNAQSANGETPLHLAARKGHRELVELLLDHHAEVNARDRQDATPLQYAAAAGHLEVVQALLANNADPSARDKSDRTPKTLAAENGHWNVVELLTPRVGNFGDLQRFDFEGAKTFSAQTLRRALKDTSDFFEVSHPLAPQGAYLEAIERKLQIGCQHHGFLDAQISVHSDAKTGRILVKLTEGPRYVCGALKVTGTRKMPPTAIVDRLTVSRALTQPAQQAFDFKDQAPTTHPLKESGPDVSEQTDAFWVKGAPAPGSQVDLRQIKALVTDAMRERGFLFPKATVLVVPDKAAGTAELRVEILEEGPLGVIDRIEVVGNKKNRSEAVLRYLDLKAGMALTGQLVSTVEDRLWRAARFLDYKVSLGSPDSTGRVPLQIHLVEYDQAPGLEENFSPAEQAMLNLRQWLSKLDQSREDLVVRLSGLPNQSSEFEFVLSPVGGLALRQSDTSRKLPSSIEYGAVLRANLAGAYSRASGRKLRLACPTQQLKAFVIVTPTSAGTNESPFDVSMGAGFSQPAQGVSAPPPYSFALSLPPVACVGLAHRLNFTDRFDGDLLVRSNATTLLKLDAKTGRINEFRLTNKEKGITAEAGFEVGALDRAVNRIEEDSANLPNAFDTNAPFSSVVAFLTEEVLASHYLESFLRTSASSNAFARLPALVHQLNLATILSPLDQFLSQQNPLPKDDGDFSIPEDIESAATANGFMALFGNWLLQHSDELVAARSWLWTLLREAGLIVQQKARYTDQALNEIYESSETGPLGYWATATLLDKMQSPLAKKFAARGLERLSAEDFRRDCRLFLTGDSVLSRCFQKLAVALPGLDDEELASLVAPHSPARAGLIRQCSQKLRAAKDQPVFDVIVPALDSYWQTELRDQVAAALREQVIDPVAVYNKALTMYQSEGISQDYTQAAKLFQQAAEGGHAGAQYYLAVLYEKGTGVPRDFSIAVKWYRESAMKGCVEAAMALGNLYIDGFHVSQNHLEAFVWYSVAAAQGHKVAPVLRDSLKRRLSATQLAEGEKQVAAMLAR